MSDGRQNTQLTDLVSAPGGVKQSVIDRSQIAQTESTWLMRGSQTSEKLGAGNGYMPSAVYLKS